MLPGDVVVSISEVFASIQGEGASLGTPSAFVRLQGCSVGCQWCDTKYSWDPARGRRVGLTELLDDVKALGAINVVVTGGEPLENAAFVPLIQGLRERGHRVEVETAGIAPPPRVDVDQWNVSPKLAHSGVALERRRHPEALARFRALGAWFKFVVGDERDVDEVLEIQRAHGLDSDRVILMPLGLTRAEQDARTPAVVAACRRHGFRFSPRLHILIWGPRRGV